MQKIYWESNNNYTRYSCYTGILKGPIKSERRAVFELLRKNTFLLSL